MLGVTSRSANRQAERAEVPPLPLWQAVLYFALPALLSRLSIYSGMPALIGWGLSPFEAFVVAFTVPGAVLFAFAFGLFKMEGHPLTWHALAERFRLRRMTGRDIVWTIVGFVVSFLGTGVLGFSAVLIIELFPALAPPAFFPPMLDPSVTLTREVWVRFVGAPLEGNWGVFILYSILLFFNIFGEELWWRGVILPRQELVHGRRTWIIHGVLWTLFHVPFYPWQVLALLPVCLTIAFVAQRRQNTWPAIILHALVNGLPLVMVLAMVLGIV